MLKIVMEDLKAGEVAAMYQEGEDAVIMVSRNYPDDERCRAVNDLLASVRAQYPVEVRPGTLLSLIA